MAVLHKNKIAKKLIRAVKDAVRLSYAPYSRITVAAGFYCAQGRIYTGVNIENSSYSLTMCAERVALYKAVSEGEKNFMLLLLYSPQINFITPCGACLQVLREFAPNLVIATMNKNEEFKFYLQEALLTKPFKI